MYQTSIPFMLHEHFRQEETLHELQRTGTSRVFLAIGTVSFDPQKRTAALNLLRENIPYFKSHGFEVGVWFWTFLHANQEADTRSCTLQRDHLGKIAPGRYCPLSPGYLEDVTEFVKEVAAMGPDILQFDDDYRLPSNDSSVGCFCEHHLARMQEILGEDISREELYQKAFSGTPNRYRSAVLRANGESMESFAAAVRKAVDSVDPKIRFSLCSCMPTWDYNGTNSIRIAKLLAGNTRPMLRFIGAPYWGVHKSWGNRLQHVVELTRMEASWCDGENIETMSEGDVYPRPRHLVPANFLEGYDTALRFSGETDGILKYMLDYVSSPGYETGYIDRHVKHQNDYAAIETSFSALPSVGVRVYNAMTKFEDADLTDIAMPHRYGWDIFFSRAARLLSDNSIPTTYRGTGCCGICFGENARHLPPKALDHGLILDIRAAKILMEQGVDVGLESIGKACKTEMLHYPAENEDVISGYQFDSSYDIRPKKDAEILTFSSVRTVKGTETAWDGSDRDEITRFPDTIRYTNAAGQKFLVFGFDAYFTDELRWRSYCMQRQLIDAVEWLSGKPLAAKCPGNPDLYLQCKENETALGVGLWNFFADEIEHPVITLDRPYRNISFINCSGTLNGNTVALSSLSPFGYALFRVSDPEK